MTSNQMTSCDTCTRRILRFNVPGTVCRVWIPPAGTQEPSEEPKDFNPCSSLLALTPCQLTSQADEFVRVDLKSIVGVDAVPNPEVMIRQIALVGIHNLIRRVVYGASCLADGVVTAVKLAIGNDSETWIVVRADCNFQELGEVPNTEEVSSGVIHNLNHWVVYGAGCLADGVLTAVKPATDDDEDPDSWVFVDDRGEESGEVPVPEEDISDGWLYMDDLGRIVKEEDDAEDEDDDVFEDAVDYAIDAEDDAEDLELYNN